MVFRYYIIIIYAIEIIVSLYDTLNVKLINQWTIQRFAGFKHLGSLTTFLHTLIFNDRFATQKSPVINNIIDCVISEFN